MEPDKNRSIIVSRNYNYAILYIVSVGKYFAIADEVIIPVRYLLLLLLLISVWRFGLEYTGQASHKINAMHTRARQKLFVSSYTGTNSSYFDTNFIPVKNHLTNSSQTWKVHE